MLDDVQHYKHMQLFVIATNSRQRFGCNRTELQNCDLTVSMVRTSDFLMSRWFPEEAVICALTQWEMHKELTQ